MIDRSRVVSVFGGSAPKAGSEAYEAARELGRRLALAGFAVATGGYGGVMSGASQGAAEAGGHVIGVTCAQIETWRGDLMANRWVAEEIRYRTLRERLHHLVASCEVAVAMPGGIGTLSEIALTWSLMQTREIPRKPLVLVGRLWRETFSTFLREADGYIHPHDGELMALMPDVDAAMGVIEMMAK